MIILSGYLGGRTIISKSRSTHPMSEKMRGAIFNALGDIEGLRVLDVFSGSGAISFESISRRAKYVAAIESNKFAQNDILKNKGELKIHSGFKLYKQSLSSWLMNKDKELFDIIVADPPYDKVVPDQLKTLEEYLKPAGILVLSFPPKQDKPLFEELSIVNEKNYGDSLLVFFKKSK